MIGVDADVGLILQLCSLFWVAVIDLSGCQFKTGWQLAAQVECRKTTRLATISCQLVSN